MARILLVDDDLDLLATMSHNLAAAGHEIVTACQGYEGLDAMRRHAAELMVIDLLMPEKEGMETIREVRQGHPDVKIIAISGGGRAVRKENYLATATDIGADLVLQKPFSNAALLASVQKLISGPGAQVQ